MSLEQQTLPDDVLFAIIRFIPQLFEIPDWTTQRLPLHSPAHDGYKLLGNLALMSHFLRHEAQREMFRSVLISSRSTFYDIDVGEYYIKTFAIFKSNPHLFNHIRTCVLAVDNCLSGDHYQASSVDTAWFVGKLQRLDAMGFIQRSQPKCAFEGAVKDWAQQVYLDCLKNNISTLKIFLTLNLTFSDEFFSHLPPGVKAVITDWHRSILPPRHSPLLSRRVDGPEDVQTALEFGDSVATPRPKFLHFTIQEEAVFDGKQHIVNLPGTFFSHLVSLTIDVAPGPEDGCRAFLRRFPFPFLQHLALLHSEHGRKPFQIDQEFGTDQEEQEEDTQLHRGVRRALSSDPQDIESRFSSLRTFTLRFSRNMFHRFSMDSVREYLECLPPSATPLQTLNLFMIRSAIPGWDTALVEYSDNVRALDEIFAEGNAFPELKVINLWLLSRRKKTIGRMQKELRGTTLFPLTQSSGAVILNVLIPNDPIDTN